MDRREVYSMSDMGLSLAFSRTADRLSQAWRRGDPGRLSDALDLALLAIEAQTRALPLAPVNLAGQPTLFELAQNELRATA